MTQIEKNSCGSEVINNKNKVLFYVRINFGNGTTNHDIQFQKISLGLFGKFSKILLY